MHVFFAVLLSGVSCFASFMCYAGGHALQSPHGSTQSLCSVWVRADQLCACGLFAFWETSMTRTDVDEDDDDHDGDDGDDNDE